MTETSFVIMYMKIIIYTTLGIQVIIYLDIN